MVSKWRVHATVKASNPLQLSGSAHLVLRMTYSTGESEKTASRQRKLLQHKASHLTQNLQTSKLHTCLRHPLQRPGMPDGPSPLLRVIACFQLL